MSAATGLGGRVVAAAGRADTVEVESAALLNGDIATDGHRRGEGCALSHPAVRMKDEVARSSDGTHHSATLGDQVECAARIDVGVGSPDAAVIHQDGSDTAAVGFGLDRARAAAHETG